MRIYMIGKEKGLKLAYFAARILILAVWFIDYANICIENPAFKYVCLYGLVACSAVLCWYACECRKLKIKIQWHVFVVFAILAVLLIALYIIRICQ